MPGYRGEFVFLGCFCFIFIVVLILVVTQQIRLLNQLLVEVHTLVDGIGCAFGERDFVNETIGHFIEVHFDYCFLNVLFRYYRAHWLLNLHLGLLLRFLRAAI